MAIANLLTLLDDIATVLDDVAVYSKVAATKTAPVLGDDLAVNAEQVAGVSPARELPVVWAVAKGSLLNKCILVPVALLMSAFYPPMIQWMLILGGTFLCFEGTEKIIHTLSHHFSKHKNHPIEKVPVDEKLKIKGAIRTDFVLSAEIVVIALGAMAALPLMIQALSLSVFAVAMTLFVYGLVAVIVKLDDVGLHFTQRDSSFVQGIGRGLLWFAPRMMKSLTVIGTFAMFLVGGGILLHGFHIFHDWELSLLQTMSIGEGLTHTIVEQLYILILGFVIGLIVFSVVSLASSIKDKLTN
ncbi:MAG: DUF808 domain-containing protein [Sinobacterium sp.]|nr:DUF808 domain-containing protein [Sinobacterium sp.]